MNVVSKIIVTVPWRRTSMKQVPGVAGDPIEQPSVCLRTDGVECRARQGTIAETNTAAHECFHTCLVFHTGEAMPKKHMTAW